MSETADFDPGPWKGHNFSDARDTYASVAGRTYDDAVNNNKSVNDLVPESVSSNSESPVVICCDITGSMGEWPKTIFSKLPYLDLEGKEYLGKDMEISFCAIGDGGVGDPFALQVREFSSGTDLKEQLAKLVVAGGGGSNYIESYDLAAVYYAFNCETPKATLRPIFIFIGDEGLYDSINKGVVEQWARTTKATELRTIQNVFAKLKEKFSVYCIHKPYGSGYSGYGGSVDNLSPRDQEMLAQWESLIGPDHVMILPQAERVVDVIFGIFAKETNRVDYFKSELKERQRPDQVKQVLAAVSTIHRLPPHNPRTTKNASAGASVTRRRKGGSDPSKSIPLV